MRLWGIKYNHKKQQCGPMKSKVKVLGLILFSLILIAGIQSQTWLYLIYLSYEKT